MAAEFILAVYQVPNELVNQPGGPCTPTGNSIFLCTGNTSGRINTQCSFTGTTATCPSNNWALNSYRSWTSPCGEARVTTACTPAYDPNIPVNSGDNSPYAYMAGYNGFQTGGGHGIFLPYNQHPDSIGDGNGPSVLGGHFAVLSDQTTRTLAESLSVPGPAQLIVAYRSSWFHNEADYETLVNWVGILNATTNNYSYNGVPIPSLAEQNQFSSGKVKNNEIMSYQGNEMAWVSLIIIILVILVLFFNLRKR